MTPRPVVVLDGPMGTELDAAGRRPARAGLERARPRRRAGARRRRSTATYVAAGATVHTTNTFRTKRRSVGARWEELARRAVAIARANVGQALRVAGQHRRRSKTATGPISARGLGVPGRAPRARPRRSPTLASTFSSARRSPTRPRPRWRSRRLRGRASRRGPRSCRCGPACSATTARARASTRARARCSSTASPRAHTLPFVEQLAGLGVPFGAYANAGDARRRRRLGRRRRRPARGSTRRSRAPGSRRARRSSAAAAEPGPRTSRALAGLRAQ